MAKMWGRYVVKDFPRTAGATRALFRPVTLTPGSRLGQALGLFRRGGGDLGQRDLPSARASPARIASLARAPFALRKGRGTSGIFRASGGNAAASGIPCGLASLARVPFPSRKGR